MITDGKIFSQWGVYVKNTRHILPALLFITGLILCIPALQAQTTSSPSNQPPTTADSSPKKNDLNSWWTGTSFIYAGDTLSKSMDEHGVNIVGSYSLSVLSNVSGGINSATEYAQLANLGVNLDLEKIAGIKGLQFQVTAMNALGQNLAADTGGLISPANQFAGHIPVGLYEMYFRQDWKDSGTYLAGGRISVADYFASSPLYMNYVSYAYNGSPWSLTANNPNFSANPDANWMFVGGTKIMEGLSFQAAVCGSSSPNINQPWQRGTDLSWEPSKGAMYLGEVTQIWKTDIAGTKGLEGTLKIGGYYDTATMTNLTSIGTTKGMGSLYATAQQQLTREGDDSSAVGLSAWGTFVYAPQEASVLIPYFTSGGLCYTGLIPSRAADVTAVAVSSAWQNQQLPATENEINFELTYLIQINNWWSIQPDFQAIINPSGSNTLPTAYVLGFSTNVNF